MVLNNMPTLHQEIRRKYLLAVYAILALLTTTSIVIFHHPIFWAGVTLLQDPNNRVSLLQVRYLPTLFILLGGMQIIFALLLLIGGGLYLLFHCLSPSRMKVT
jgi:hypothetical protein